MALPSDAKVFFLGQYRAQSSWRQLQQSQSRKIVTLRRNERTQLSLDFAYCAETDLEKLLDWCVSLPTFMD